jgi:hypothetical protein
MDIWIRLLLWGEVLLWESIRHLREKIECGRNLTGFRKGPIWKWTMPTFKYLSVVAAVLAAAFFLARTEAMIPTNSYVDAVPAAISALPMLASKVWSDDWHQTNKATLEEFVSVSSF